MKKIRPEDTEFMYLTQADGLPKQGILNLELVGIPDKKLWNETLSRSMKDMRVILIQRSIVPDKAFVYFLHWDDGLDLLEPDIRVERDGYVDSDFENSIKAELDKTTCFECGWLGSIYSRCAEW